MVVQGVNVRSSHALVRVELDVDRVDLIDHVRERAQELLELGVLAGRDVVLVERASCVRK